MVPIQHNFRHAWRGIVTLIKTERSFRIHLLIAFLVLSFALYQNISKILMVGLLLIIAFIISLEIFNSAIERLVDMLAPRTHKFAKEVKDLLAAMVLIASLFAVIIGLIIFL